MADWKTWETGCSACQKCALASTRHQVVLGVGPKDAEVVFVGEAPGENEDLQGEPFIGRGGKLLDEVLQTVGLSRESNIYITNIVKCRPPQNRDPKPQERDACMPWLCEQFSLIKPRIVVCLGRVAACSLINPNYKVTKEHGLFFEKDSTLYMGTFHPAAILRDPRKKGEWVADFQALRKKIEEVCQLIVFE
ncbi:MAG: uracil-DNA glycosylase [Clostridia bacterium]|nr:uracil-DNA glycosylase [Clostridia bacterium]